RLRWMTMARYSKELKQKIVQRMMPPNNERASELAKENGLSEATLYKWKKEAMEKGFAVPGSDKNAEKWSTRDKFAIVVETAARSEIELSEYCRAKGLYVEQVAAWRDACMQAIGGVAEQANMLQKELRNKEREMKKLSR